MGHTPSASPAKPGDLLLEIKTRRVLSLPAPPRAGLPALSCFPFGRLSALFRGRLFLRRRLFFHRRIRLALLFGSRRGGFDRLLLRRLPGRLLLQGIGHFVERFRNVLLELRQGLGEAVGALANLLERRGALLSETHFTTLDPFIKRLARGSSVGRRIVEFGFQLVDELPGFVEVELHAF